MSKKVFFCIFNYLYFGVECLPTLNVKVHEHIVWFKLIKGLLAWIAQYHMDLYLKLTKGKNCAI